MVLECRSAEIRRMPRHRPAVVEGVAFVVAAALATVYAERRILFTPHVYQSDALLLEYWMRRFQDPQLFTDPLTHALIHTAYVPFGVEGLYRVASYLMDPIRFGAWGAVVLAPFSAFLVFRIIREHTAWIPAAWLGAALFLLPWSTERFSGTHARAFAQPIVLLTLYLMLRGRIRWAAVVPPVGALFYPPASILAGGMLAAAALGRQGRRPAIDRRLAQTAAVSIAAMLAALLAPRLAGVPSGHLISESAARHYPEFGPHGQMSFFRKSVWQMLRGRYSGFDLQGARSHPADRGPRDARSAAGQCAARAEGGLGGGGGLADPVRRELRGALSPVPPEPLHTSADTRLLHRDRRVLETDLVCARPAHGNVVVAGVRSRSPGRHRLDRRPLPEARARSCL